MSDSILTSTKKVVGLEADDTSFDLDIVMHINAALATLSQLGIGPANGFMIEDAVTTWENLLGQDLNLNAAKLYVYYKTRLGFDPPGTAALLRAVEDQIRELEWRLNVHREQTDWVAPDPPAVVTDEFGQIIIDGGIG